MRRILTVLFSVLALGVTACGSDPVSLETPEPDVPSVGVDEVVLIWTETGGCAMAGPNCAQYVITADGSVTTMRGTFAGFEEAASGQIAGDEVAEWIAIASSTNLEELQGRLGPGQVTAAFDGVDFVLEAPFAGHTISSTVFAFESDEPFFDGARALVLAAAEAAPLELAFR